MSRIAFSVGVAGLVAGTWRVAYTWPHLVAHPYAFWPLPAFLGIAGALAALALVASFAVRSRRLELLAAVTLGLAWLLALGLLRTVYSEVRSAGEHDRACYVDHPRYGWTRRPAAEIAAGNGRRWVVGHTDAGGFRVVPGAPAGARAVVFTGCSFTEGSGVADGETFAALLVPALAPRGVANHGQSAWGLAQIYLHVSDLVRASPPPAAVVYAFQSDQYRATAVSLPAIERLGERRRAPLLELAGADGLAFGRLFGRDDGLPPTLATDDRVLETARRALRGMKGECDAAHVPFLAVLLPELTPNRLATSVVHEALRRAGAQVLDLRDMACPPEEWLPDRHFGPALHRRVADALAPAVRALPFVPLDTGAVSRVSQ